MLIPARDVAEVVAALGFMRRRRRGFSTGKLVRIFVKPVGADLPQQPQQEPQQAPQQEEPEREEPMVEEVMRKSKQTFFQSARTRIQLFEEWAEQVIESIPGFIGRLRCRHFIFFLLAIVLCYLIILLTLAVARQQVTVGNIKNKVNTTVSLARNNCLTFMGGVFNDKSNFPLIG